MFTASHNPPEYLGMKFIPDYAGPATAEITDEIVANIDKEFKKNTISGSIKKVDFDTIYNKHLLELIDINAIK